MQANPRRHQTELRLREHIRTAWTQFLRGTLPWRKLLESVATFVRNTCPQASRVDVIADFKIWYERKIQLQKTRAAAATAAAAGKSQQQQQQQHLTAQQRRAQIISNPKPQQRKAHQASAANRPHTTGVAHLQNNTHRLPAARPVNAVNVPGTEPRLINPELMKPEPQVQSVMRTPAKNNPRSNPRSNNVQVRRTPAAKSSKGTPTKTEPVKRVIEKTAGGKSLHRPPTAAVSRAQVGIKGPSASSTPKPATARTGVAAGGKSVTANKGLLASKLPAGLVNKLPPGPRRKAPRKTPAKSTAKNSPSRSSVVKAPSPNSVGKSLPQGLAEKQKPVPLGGSNSAVGAASPATLPGSGKRPPDANGARTTGSLAKKAKPNPRGPKGNMTKKKGVSHSPTGESGRNNKPPPARADMGKGPAPDSAATGSGTTAGAVKSSKLNITPSGIARGNQIRKTKRVDDELNLVSNVVDLDDEVDKLGLDAGGGTSEVIGAFDYDADMLLSGPVLRAKMQARAKQYGLNENVSKDVMDIVSLAVRERLTNFLESLKGIAAVRVDAARQSWNTETCSESIYDRLERMREDEERSLTVAAELRVKRRKEQEEKEAKRLAGEAEKEEKKGKDASAAMEIERKEKIAMEKKRKEDSSQRDALSGLVAGIDKKRKRANTGKGLDGLAPFLPPITKSGGPRSSATLLPSLPELAGADGSGGLVQNGIRHLSKDGNPVGTLEKVKALSPLVKLGGPKTSSMPMHGKAVASNTQAKFPLTLRDCLFLMSEQDLRKNAHIYKWYARLGATPQAVNGN